MLVVTPVMTQHRQVSCNFQVLTSSKTIPYLHVTGSAKGVFSLKVTKFQVGTMLACHLMDSQIHSIGKAIRPSLQIRSHLKSQYCLLGYSEKLH